MTLDDSTLSAYLAGDLDEVSARRVHAAVRDDPALGRRLDELATVVWALQAPASAEPPDGFEDRLAGRVAAAVAEQRAGASSAGAVQERASTPARRATRRWAWTGSVAAALVAAAMLGAGTLVGFGSGEQADMATPPEAGGAELTLESAEAPVQEEVPEQEAAMDSAADDSARALGVGGPVLADGIGSITRDADVAARYTDLPEVAGLLGLDTEVAAGVAAEHLEVLERAAPFPDGTGPSQCLDEATGALPHPSVVARVELVDYRGVPAIAHVVVGTSDAAVLDRAEARLSAIDGCALLTAVELPG